MPQKPQIMSAQNPNKNPDRKSESLSKNLILIGTPRAFLTCISVPLNKTRWQEYPPEMKQRIVETSGEKIQNAKTCLMSAAQCYNGRENMCSTFRRKKSPGTLLSYGSLFLPVPRTPPSLVAQRGIQLGETAKKNRQDPREEKPYRMALRKRKLQGENRRDSEHKTRKEDVHLKRQRECTATKAQHKRQVLRPLNAQHLSSTVPQHTRYPS